MMIFNLPLEEKYSKKIIKMAKEKGFHVNLYQNNKWFVEELDNDETRHYANHTGLTPVKKSFDSFDDYSRMYLNQDKLDGIIINPYHKERSIVLNKDVIQHIRTIKEKNIKTYAKAKSYLKDRKRRQKYEIDYES